MLAALRDGECNFRPVEELLDGLASICSTSRQRVELLDQLERQFGLAMLQQDAGKTTYAEQTRIARWWESQAHPRSCVALSLVALLHRLHLLAERATQSEDDPSGEMTACFTILQGLCLKHVESSTICAQPSTLHLVLAILEASYWHKMNVASQAAIAHAIDFIICVTMTSRVGSQLFAELHGEEKIRMLMEQRTSAACALTSQQRGEASSSTTSRRTITLDDVQDDPIAMKCAEFLLLFASERNEPEHRMMEAWADQTSLFGETSIVHQLAARRRARDDRSTKELSSSSDAQRTEQDLRRGRSTSPVKEHGVKRRRDIVERNDVRKPLSGQSAPTTPRTRLSSTAPRSDALRTPLHSSSRTTSATTATTTNIALRSPAKSYPPPVHRHSTTASPTKTPKTTAKSTPFTPSTHVAVMRSRPLRTLEHNSAGGDEEENVVVTVERRQPSPVKALIGPSPAVRRAHERSMSPDKDRRSFRTPC